MSRLKCKVTVGLFLKKDDQVLLEKRKNREFENSQYAFISGHIEENESFKGAMIREAREEVGIELQEEDLKLLSIHHRNTGENYINIFFLCEKYKGQEKNCEPDKCSEISWYSMNHLPENLGESAKRALEAYKSGNILDECGWS